MDRTLWIAALALVAGGCGAQQKPLEATMQPTKAAAEAQAQADAPLREDLFQRDRSGQIDEEDLRRVLGSPVFLEREARVGVVPVQDEYDPDEGPPLTQVTGALAESLESSGLFEGVTEVTTDWPGDRGISGLRELAARYRVEYLLLYRHRFVHRKRPNNWAWLYPTVVGLFAAPGRTIEVAGVLEATLFDVKTGTLLFTAYERAHEEVERNLFQNGRKRRELEQEMLSEVAEPLIDQVVGQTGRLAAERPDAARADAAAGAGGEREPSAGPEATGASDAADPATGGAGEGGEGGAEAPAG